ncbi:hypothetical protein Tco_1395851, partial [Tanacetum coccineum]
MINEGQYRKDSEERTGLGGPNSERHILDSRGALVERRAVVCRERLYWSLSCFIAFGCSCNAIGASPDTISILSQDASFARDFQKTVMAIRNDQLIEG